MRICALFFLLSLTGGALSAGPVQMIAADVINDRLRTLAPDNQRLAGVLSNRLRANSEGFLEHVDVPALLAGYTKEPGNEGGEYAGRYLLAAAHAYEYRQEPELRAIMDRVAEALAKAQGSDGYLGVAPAAERFGKADLRVQRANLLGLLAYYQVSGEEPAYTVSQRIGDLLVKKLSGGAGKLTVELPPDDLELRLAAAQLGEPLVMLYRYTAEPAYLELAKTLVKAVDLSQTRGKLAASEGSFQAEWLNVYISLAELYRATGDATYLREAVAGWTNLAAGRLTATGVPAADKGREVSNCVTASWLRLTLYLMRITGQPKYGDQLEKTIYNHLLAGQDIRSGDLCAATSDTDKRKFLGRPAASVSPCALAEADGLSLIAQTLWGRWANGIFINLYNPGRGTFQLRRRALVQIYAESSYPERGDILLHVEPSRNARFPLRLRVPEWAETFTADFGSSHLLGKPGEWLLIEREWRRGDTVKISIAMRVQILPGTEGMGGRFAVKRGAEMLVVNRALNPQIKDLLQAAPLIGDSLPTLIPLENRMPKFWAGEEAYQVKGEYAGKPQDLTFVPFADAFDFSMWFEKQQSGSGAP